MQPPRDSLFDEFIQLASVTVSGRSISDGMGVFPMPSTTDTNTLEDSMGNSRQRRLLQGEPRFREQLHILREAVDNLGSAVSVSNDPVAHTLDMVRILVQRSVDVDPSTEPEVYCSPFSAHSLF